MDENCKRQKEVERTYGGLLPAVEGHSLGTGTGTGDGILTIQKWIHLVMAEHPEVYMYFIAIN